MHSPPGGLDKLLPKKQGAGSKPGGSMLEIQREPGKGKKLLLGLGRCVGTATAHNLPKESLKGSVGKDVVGKDRGYGFKLAQALIRRMCDAQRKIPKIRRGGGGFISGEVLLLEKGEKGKRKRLGRSSHAPPY